MSNTMTSEAMPCHRVRRACPKATKSETAAVDRDLHKWEKDSDVIPLAAHGALVDPLIETRALLQGLESMVALNFKGAQADAILCMVATAQKQVAAALAVAEKYTPLRSV